MIILLDDEADAFWCFERLMRRLVNISSTDLYVVIHHNDLDFISVLREIFYE